MTETTDNDSRVPPTNILKCRDDSQLVSSSL
jgi:hypothetical protein